MSLHNTHSSGDTRPNRASVGLRSERGPILFAVMLATALVALDSTIVATAVPSIVSDVGGFNQFPWLFSLYLLTQAVLVPVYSRLADMFGRKPMMVLGIGCFLLGSILCGLAWNMTALIIFRAVQGIGAGAVLPISITITGDIYTVAERAIAQGYIASVWAVSSVVGPALGGLFSDLHAWRFIFFVNVPLCLWAAWLLIQGFKEQVVRTHETIDYFGAILIASGTTLLILGLLEGGVAWPWISASSFGIFGVALVLLAAFVMVERRVQHPIVPMWVFQRRMLVSTSLVSALIGVIMMALTSYVPTYGQVVLGASALIAGFAVAALTLGWPIAASTAGKVYLRIGFRSIAFIGAAIVLSGTLLMTTLGAHSSLWLVAVYCAIVGFGLGWTASPTLIAAQSSVTWERRGVITANNMFARSIGSAVGVAVFGAIVNAITHTSGASVPTASALVTAMHVVFWALAILAGIMMLAVLLMPRAESMPGEA